MYLYGVAWNESSYMSELFNSFVCRTHCFPAAIVNRDGKRWFPHSTVARQREIDVCIDHNQCNHQINKRYF